MTVELQPIAGWWPIKILAVEDVVGPMTFPDGEYDDTPEFREIVGLACEEVHASWEEDHDDVWEAAERKVDELVRARAEVSL